MAHQKALWDENYLVWGQSSKTGKKFRFSTRSNKHLQKVFNASAKCAAIYNNSCCMNLGKHKNVSREEIDSEWENLKTFWNRMKGK